MPNSGLWSYFSAPRANAEVQHLHDERLQYQEYDAKFAEVGVLMKGMQSEMQQMSLELESLKVTVKSLSVPKDPPNNVESQEAIIESRKPSLQP